MLRPPCIVTVVDDLVAGHFNQSQSTFVAFLGKILFFFIASPRLMQLESTNNLKMCVKSGDHNDGLAKCLDCCW